VGAFGTLLVVWSYMIIPELFAKFQIMFYSGAEDAVFKALGLQ